MKKVPKLKGIVRSIHKRAIKIGKAAKQDLKAFTPLRVAEEFALLLVALQLAVLGANVLNQDDPVLGLRLEGQLIGQLSGGSRQQTESIIKKYENEPLTVKAAGITDTITLGQLGVDINEEQARKAMLSYGRDKNIFHQLVEQDMAAIGVRNILLESSNFDTKLATAYVTNLDKKMAIKPTNARFILDSEKVKVHPDMNGRTIWTNAALEILRQARPATNAPVVLPVKTVTADITKSLLEPLLPGVQAIVEQPLTITAGENKTTLSQEQLLDLVVPKIVPNPESGGQMMATIGFDEAKLNTVIDDVVKRAVIAPQPTIMNGRQIVKQGANGIRTEDTNTLSKVLAVLVQRQNDLAAPNEVNIPLVAVTPPVVQQAINTPRNRTGTGLVRLTFDDGPGAYSEQVLDILKRYNVHATFYVIGRNVSRYPATMQRTVSEGHRIGNHSFSHADLTRLSRAGVEQELSSTQAAIQAVCGITPTAFRPPYGATNSTVQAVAASMGMSVDLWSIDTNDWMRPGSGAITQRVLANTSPGAVVLLHVLHQDTVAALPSIIEGIRSQGYTLE